MQELDKEKLIQANADRLIAALKPLADESQYPGLKQSNSPEAAYNVELIRPVVDALREVVIAMAKGDFNATQADIDLLTAIYQPENLFDEADDEEPMTLLLRQHANTDELKRVREITNTFSKVVSNSSTKINSLFGSGNDLVASGILVPIHDVINIAYFGIGN